MATTKIHAIKTTVERSLQYITNENKTDGDVYISGIECEPKVADYQFKMTKEYYDKFYGIEGFHIIQSFKPNEVSQKIGHEIGLKLAKKITNDRFQAVISTHVDKNHVHNHIIINSVSHVDGKKFYDSKRNYKRIRETSDQLCSEYNLSVIAPKDKGKSYKEWQEVRDGSSWKEQIKQDIDNTIKNASSYNQFIAIMKQKGYQIKSGKYVSFRPTGKDRFVRGKTLGIDYSEEGIKSRIVLSRHGINISDYLYPVAKATKTYKFKKVHFKRKSLLEINIILVTRIIKELMKKETNRTINSKYVRKYNDAVIKKLSNQLIFIKDNDIKDYISLDVTIKNLEAEIQEVRENIKIMESQSPNKNQNLQHQNPQLNNLKQKYTKLKNTYRQHKDLLDTYNKIKSKEYPFNLVNQKKKEQAVRTELDR